MQPPKSFLKKLDAPTQLQLKVLIEAALANETDSMELAARIYLLGFRQGAAQYAPDRKLVNA